MRRMLCKHGFIVYLIGKLQSYSFCAEYECELDTFHHVDDPRLRRRRVTGGKQIKCHGLLKCKSKRCMDDVTGLKPKSAHIRNWNRDVAAICNFCHILFGLHKNGKCFNVLAVANLHIEKGQQTRSRSRSSQRQSTVDFTWPIIRKQQYNSSSHSNRGQHLSTVAAVLTSTAVLNLLTHSSSQHPSVAAMSLLLMSSRWLDAVSIALRNGD
ncbi:hypothetical protein BX070DRAFT_251777 [Coemansia spiralis]|nr:hypothetical protein BX070DRAFT_251777 [Coemansia spiralis]